MYRKILTIFLTIIFLVISVNAAAVEENDGGAFITKGEFDSMRNQFQATLDSYNRNINSKIDQAIAEYLSAAKTSRTSIMTPLVYGTNINYIHIFNKENPMSYEFGWPRIKFDIGETRYPYKSTPQHEHGYARVYANPVDITDATKSKKTVISGLTSYGDNCVAAFDGYYVDCDDLINLYMNQFSQDSLANQPTLITHCGWAKQGSGYPFLVKDTNLLAGKVTLNANFRTSSSNSDDDTNSTSPIYVQPYVRDITHNWGTQKYRSAVCWKSYDYDMFSNHDRDYNFGYDGTYITTFDGYTNVKWTSAGQDISNFMSKSSKSPVCIWAYRKCTSFGTASNSGGTKNISYATTMRAGHGMSSGTFYVPMVGFERKYLTNWIQIYQKYTSDVANFDKTNYANTIKDSIVQTDANTYYLTVSAGMPIVKLANDTVLDSFTLEFEDKTKNYIIWVGDRPFPSDEDPKDTSNLVTIQGLDNVTSLNGFKVKNGEGVFSYNNPDKKSKILYIKWGVLNDDNTCSCEGNVRFGDNYFVTTTA